MSNWSDEECQRLVQLADAGVSVARASVILRRNMKAVQTQARKLGRPFPAFHAAKRERQARFAAATRAAPRRTG